MSIVVMGPRRSGRTTLLKSIAAANQFTFVIDDLEFHPDAHPANDKQRFLVSICGGPQDVPKAFRNAVFIPLPPPSAIHTPESLHEVVPPTTRRRK